MPRGWLVLTGAVEPDPLASPGAIVVDPAERLQQYQQALQFYIRHAERLGLTVAFIETTGFPFDRFVETDAVNGDDIDWHSFDSANLSSDVRRRGKGAIEALAIDEYMAARDFPESDWLVKVTGRLLVHNLEVTLADDAAEAVRVRRTLDRSYCDTRVLAARRWFWRQHWKGMASDIDEAACRYIEHATSQRLIEAEYSGISIGRFTTRPLIAGSSGATGAIYSLRGQRFKAIADYAIRPLVEKLRATQV